MVGSLVRFPSSAIYFFITHMSLSASDILLFVVNSPNISFQVHFEPTQCRNWFLFQNVVEKGGV